MAARARRGTRPDPAKVAAEVLAESGQADEATTEAAPRRGRPPGSKTKNKRATQTPREPYVATEEGAQLAGMLGGTIWSLLGPLANLRALKSEEQLQLGRALDPLLWKYLPVLGDWQIEFNAAVVVLGLIQATRIPKGELVEYELRPEYPNDTTDGRSRETDEGGRPGRSDASDLGPIGTSEGV